IRHLLDLDADPVAIDSTFAGGGLRRLSRAHPGLRSPGQVDGFETAVRAVIGQQISVAGARTVAGRLAASFGDLMPSGDVLFPSAEAIAEADPAMLPMPASRAATLVSVARAVADGGLVLDRGADRDQVRAALLAMRGIGVWTADYVLMRALGDPDILLDTDLGVRTAAAAADVDLSTRRPEWAPYRTYATHLLWRALS
ncbi:MAG TPA: AlkA N-terminal domain-containing protein, partial [Jatrophihabitans sp.]